MYSFRNDYSECCHPAILDRIASLGTEANAGYGTDPYCAAAAEKIRSAAACPEAAVHFLVGGTQTNLTIIDAALRPYEAVIAAQTGHINTHETGAIEGTGHKVLTAVSKDGKLNPELIAAILSAHTDEHMVKPRMVYLSDSTELGTIYTKAELIAISAFCRRHGLYLFLDGARLGTALVARENDLTLPDLARLCDVFYIGGTKNGAMFGEAVVIPHPAIAAEFRYEMKHRGSMLAKGYLLGLNFDTLFTDGLYWQLADAAYGKAVRLREGLLARQVPLYVDSPTNQVFPVFPNEKLQELEKNFCYEIWEKVDEDHTAIRLVTSWATTDETVDAFLAAL